MTLPAGIQDLASHVKVLNLPFRPHVAVPPPENPSLHVTVTICPVYPVILPVPALFELTTLPAGIQSKSHVNLLNWLFEPHLAVPPPEYPSLHVTVTVWPVVPERRQREQRLTN